MDFELPTKARPAVLSLPNVFGYGIPKVGKTCMWAEDENALFLTTEDRHTHVTIIEQRIDKWLTFVKTIQKLEALKAEDFIYTRYVIDIIEHFHRYAQHFICAQHNVRHLSDIPYGKGWDLCKDLVITHLLRLSNIAPNKGLARVPIVMLCHGKEKTIKQRAAEYTAILPNLSDSVVELYTGFCDQILYYTTNSDGQRIIISEASRYINAGDCTGLLPKQFSMGANPKEGYDLYQSFMSGELKKEDYMTEAEKAEEEKRTKAQESPA
jgi:hypothetical protein